MQQDDLKIERRGGVFINPPLGVLYVNKFLNVREYSRGGLYLSGLFSEAPSDVTKILFASDDASLKTKKTLAAYDLNQEIDLAKIVDLNRKKVHVAKGDVVIYRGIYYAKDGRNKNVFFWLQGDSIHFVFDDEEVHLPFSKVYICSYDNASGDDPIFFRRLDHIYAQVTSESFHEFEDAELLLELQLVIVNLNARVQPNLDELIAATKAKVLQLEESPLLEKVVIRCVDGSFVFYPILIPFSFSLSHSLFQRLSWDRDVITLNYKVKEIKPLFVIFLNDRLPSPGELVKSGSLAMYAELSDYLGVGFYSHYFSRIIDSLPYRTLTIPATGSVEGYLSFLGGEDLQAEYEKFWPRVDDKNFYIALHESGMSVAQLVRSVRTNPSRALQEFLDEYH